MIFHARIKCPHDDNFFEFRLESADPCQRHDSECNGGLNSNDAALGGLDISTGSSMGTSRELKRDCSASIKGAYMLEEPSFTLSGQG